MPEVTIRNVIRRANRKLAPQHSIVWTSRGWREKSNIGRWHLCDGTNTVINWWQTVEAFQDWARDLGVLHETDIVVEN